MGLGAAVSEAYIVMIRTFTVLTVMIMVNISLLHHMSLQRNQKP